MLVLSSNFIEFVYLKGVKLLQFLINKKKCELQQVKIKENNDQWISQ